MKKFLCAMAMLATAAQAAAEQRPVSAAEFEARVTGKTYTYSIDGSPYGVEEYHPNRRVTWSYLDGECQEGEWYAKNDQICFVYENIEGEQCWTFTLTAGRLKAQFGDDAAGTTLYQTDKADEPMVCLGPLVGV